MPKLSQLIAEFDASFFVICDDGNGSGYAKGGETLRYNDDAAAKYGEVELSELDKPEFAAIGTEVNFASDWITEGEGDNPYLVQIRF